MRILTSILAFGTILISHAAAATDRPNFVVIMADDMGFSDIGCYGSEIDTPHLDALAAAGLRFTHFHNAARCCPTRAALLTGLYPHQAGVGHMTRDDGLPGYRGRLNDRCLTLAEALKPAGYATMAIGKWHVGSNRGHWPLDRGFEKYWGTPAGGGVYFKETLQIRKNVFFVSGNERVDVPDDFYVTDDFTTHAIEFVEDTERRDDQPFLLYLAHIAPHWPLQAKEEDIEKYDGRYDAGWDAIRAARFNRQKSMGIVSEAATLSPRDPRSRPWKDLTPNEQRKLANRMEIYAAQVDCIDQNVGRLVETFKKTGEFENTLVLFLSDNGCSAEGGPGGFSRGRKTAPIGTGLSYASVGLEWANAADTPYRKFKMHTYEGGTATPLVAHWPAGIAARGELRHQPGHMIDIMPTLLELAGATYPDSYDGTSITPLAGKSLVPAFADKTISREGLYWEHQGNKAVRQGDWKALAPHGGAWELYNLRNDPTEIENLAETKADRTASLAKTWSQWAERCNVWDWDALQKHRRQQRRERNAKEK